VAGALWAQGRAIAGLELGDPPLQPVAAELPEPLAVSQVVLDHGGSAVVEQLVGEVEVRAEGVEFGRSWDQAGGQQRQPSQGDVPVVDEVAGVPVPGAGWNSIGFRRRPKSAMRSSEILRIRVVTSSANQCRPPA
jgi:hypothetical protein